MLSLESTSTERGTIENEQGVFNLFLGRGSVVAVLGYCRCT